MSLSSVFMDSNVGFSSAWKLIVDIVYIRFLFADGEST